MFPSSFTCISISFIDDFHALYFVFFQFPNINNIFTDMEKFALVVGSFCHDIDHRGTNNAFLIRFVHSKFLFQPFSVQPMVE